MSCAWCHNPESQFLLPQVLIRSDRCQGCAICSLTCSHHAVRLEHSRRRPHYCPACGECVALCPHNALELVGKVQTIDQIMQEVMKDEPFYDESGGGVSFSGGEPLLQAEFLGGLLLASRQQNLHTVVDTSGHAPWEDWEHLVPLIDRFLYDVKLMDSDKHLHYTGQPNRLILDNLVRLVQVHRQVEVRVPIIPDINTDQTDLAALTQFLQGLPILGVRLLPYHTYGVAKYEQLGHEYRLSGTVTPTAATITAYEAYLSAAGINVL